MSEPSPSRRPWTGADLLELLPSLAAFALAVAGFARFAARVETRPGVVLRDPILALLTPHDMTWVIFTLIYVAVVSCLVLLSRDPPALSLGLRAYAVMVLLRMLTMAVTPLAAPAGAIPLRDPFVEQLWNGQTLTRDLFFSGHTATLCVVTFSTRHRAARRLFAAAAIAVGGCLLLQAVHYTVDVLAAPFFAYAAYRFAAATGRRRAPGAAGTGTEPRRLRTVPRHPPLDRKAS